MRVIRRVAADCVIGRPLVVAPELVLVRWPDRRPPEPGVYVGDLEPEIVTCDVLAVMAALSGPPVTRCEALERLPDVVRTSLYSYPQVCSMVRVALDLEPPLREHLRRHGASLRSLFWVVGVRGLAAQASRWNAWLERSLSEKDGRRARGRPRTGLPR